MPFLLKVGFKKDDFNYYGSVGPYIAYAIGGKYKINLKYEIEGFGIVEEINQKGKIKFNKESEDWFMPNNDMIVGSNDYSRFDYGI